MIRLVVVLAVCLSGCRPVPVSRPVNIYSCVSTSGCHMLDLSTYGRYSRYWRHDAVNNKPVRGVWKVQ